MRCCSQSPPASRKVRMPLSALMPAPVSTNTRIPRRIGIGEKATPGATRGSGIIARHGCAPAAGGQDPPMFVQDLRRELSRRFYIRSRTARTAALRIAYVVYASTLNGWHIRRPEPQAAASLRRRIEQLFDEDWQDADAGLYPRELIEALPWREYVLAPLKLLDVACGTGHFLRMLGAALPGARLFGVDLSPHYLARARETLPREVDVSLVCENAESLPFPDGHFDVATNVFLLHELPPEV